MQRMGNAPNIPLPRCSEQGESHHNFICKLSKITLDYISEVISLDYTFNNPFKFSLKTIIMGASPQSHNGIDLKILPTLLEVFRRHLFYCHRKVFHEDGYIKVSELSNFKCNHVSHFNKLGDTATELGLKGTFSRTWNSIVNNNGSLNIQFNYLFFPLCNTSE